jgi:23S rRNA-/tRNA-specific pseudouridylate synthase
VALPIARDPERTPHWNVAEDGAPAETRFRWLGRGPGGDLLEAVPVTGRTNQIRIHSAAIGHPLLGDTLYGGAPAARLFLHAWTLEIPAEGDGRRLIVAPVPPEFSDEASHPSFGV